MKKPKPIAPYTGVFWPLGKHVQIQRPHLWSGLTGEVQAVDERRGIHRVWITAENGHVFGVEATGDLLRPI